MKADTASKPTRKAYGVEETRRLLERVRRLPREHYRKFLEGMAKLE